MERRRGSGATQPIRIATRGSRLALAQARLVGEALAAARPGVDFELVPVTTRGDADRRAFADIGGKGLFVKEVEAALADGAADLAVHSAKDLTAELAPGCVVVAVPRRGPVHDVVIGSAGGTGEERLGRLGVGARVGTSSMRRRAQLAEAAPDVTVTEFRGNLDTRLAKVADGAVDAAIVAAAGLERLGAEVDAGALNPDWWVPAPGQGALAIEALSERADLAALVEPIADRAGTVELECERAFSEALEGGCSVPLGCLARFDKGRLVVMGYLGSPDGGYAFRDRVSGGAEEAGALGRELAAAILDGGGRDILDEIRTAEAVDPAVP